MAQAGFTPIQLYRTTTASAQPSAGNLADGELAINLTDKKLYAKDASNNVYVLADASSGGTTATNLAGGAAGSLPYQTGANATTFLGIGTAAQVLQVNSGATAPEWVNTSGTGDVARTTSPSFTTPSLGAATALSINSLTLTTSTGTFTLANGKTLTVNNSLTLNGTDATVMTFPSTSATIARTDAAQTFTGTQTVQAAATQDAVALAGRAGGTSSYVSTLTPTTLSASRTVTLPDADTTVPVATQVLTFTGPTAGRTITLPDANFTVARSDAAQSFTGTQTFLSNPVLDAGTANGVLYLNASKVVTSGSALTFDGAILGVNGVSVGRGAGAVGTNVVVGASALASNTTGNRNTAVGYLALNPNTTGSENTAVGYGALDANSTGNESNAFGTDALGANTTGSSNSAFGSAALRANTTASDNTGLGYATLLVNTTGAYNTAVGSRALFSNTTASNNTAVGYQALYSATTSGTNTALGHQAGYSATTGDATSKGVFIGHAAGYSVTTGVRNTFVGANAGNDVTTGNNNTILGRYSGNQGGLDIRTADNYIVLSDGDGNPRAYWDSIGQQNTLFTGVSGSVGVRSVSSASGASDAYHFVGTSNGTDTIRITTEGNINQFGGQITFPATQNASSNANTLDDYEEGTWTATLVSSGGGSVTVTSSAKYIKIGNLVFVSVESYDVSTTGLSSGDLTITGLPFTCSSSSSAIAYFDIAGAVSASQGSVVAYASNTTTIDLYKTESTNANVSFLTKADVNSGVSIRFNGTYTL